MNTRTLADWLAYQERLHTKAIDLGLERVGAVAQRLGLLPARAVTLAIAGTNGKGSSATLAAGIYRAAGYRVGLYTSPHLLAYNERVALDGVPAGDAKLCQAFETVERARGDTPLTYFEFGTLAALLVFRQAAVDVQVLEVGLGGRLDAVNIIDADCALITNIGLDHTDLLGGDRERIGYEKAGILRPQRPAICVEAVPPASLLEHGRRIGAPLSLLNRDFSYAIAGSGWDWRSGTSAFADLPAPGLAGAVQYRNAAGVLAAVAALRERLPVNESAIRAALPALRLRGRYERVGDTVLDVAHNAEAAEVLAANLRADPVTGTTRLVLGMLADKPVEAVCRALAPVVRDACFGSLPPPRGLDAGALQARAAAGGLTGLAAGSVAEAYQRARLLTGPGDRILVCGSFLTVAAAAQILNA